MNMTELMMLTRALERLVLTHLQPDPRQAVMASPVEMLLLSEVYRNAPVSVGELRQSTGFAQSYISTLIARLSERGLLSLSTDPADRRRTLVSPHPGMLGHLSTSLRLDARQVIDDLVGADGSYATDDVIPVLEFLLERARESSPSLSDQMDMTNIAQGGSRR